jgi:hypothetical protein
MEVSGQPHASAALTPGDNPSTHWIGGWASHSRSARFLGENKKKSVACTGIRMSDRLTVKIPKERSPQLVGNCIKIRTVQISEMQIILLRNL